MPGRFYRRSGEVASRIISGEALLVKSSESDILVLNPAGARLWVMADGTRSEDDLVSSAADVEAARDFLRKLASLGFLEESDLPIEPPLEFPQEVEWPPEADAEPPAVIASEKMEVLASVCDSATAGASGCRTVGVCINAYT